MDRRFPIAEEMMASTRIAAAPAMSTFAVPVRNSRMKAYPNATLRVALTMSRWRVPLKNVATGLTDLSG